MQFTYSRFGTKLSAKSGILELMDDLGTALSGKDKMIMMGGGNPAHIPEIEQIWRNRMHELVRNGKELDAMLGNYDSPRGNPEFLEALAGYFRNQYGWAIGPENIALTNGSQNAFFILFNMLAGEMPDGSFRKIVLPLVPEYIGYADQGIGEEFFQSFRPEIEIQSGLAAVLAAQARPGRVRVCWPGGSVASPSSNDRWSDPCWPC